MQLRKFHTAASNVEPMNNETVSTYTFQSGDLSGFGPPQVRQLFFPISYKFQAVLEIIKLKGLLWAKSFTFKCQ